jgi:hypothetical protein
MIYMSTSISPSPLELKAYAIGFVLYGVSDAFRSLYSTMRLDFLEREVRGVVRSRFVMQPIIASRRALHAADAGA